MFVLPELKSTLIRQFVHVLIDLSIIRRQMPANVMKGTGKVVFFARIDHTGTPITVHVCVLTTHPLMQIIAQNVHVILALGTTQ